MPKLIQCPYCHELNLKPYAARIRENYPHTLRVICCKCGLIFSNPQATPEELSVFYQNYYDKGNFVTWKQKTLIWKARFDKSHTDKRNSYIFNNLVDVRSGFKWLEIGAGLGKLSYIAKSKGLSVTVSEIDNDAIEFLNKQMGFTDILPGDLESLYQTNLLIDENYDIVVMNHVLEHVIDLFTTLNIVHHILKPRGIFYIGVPNLDSFGYTIYRAMCYLTMKIPGIVDGIEHTYGFTPRTLRQCLHKAQFEIKQIRTKGKDETISTLVETWHERGISKALVAFSETIFKTRMECIAIKRNNV